MNMNYVDSILLKNFSHLKIVADLVFMVDEEANDGNFFALKFFAPRVKAWVRAASEDRLKFCFVEEFGEKKDLQFGAANDVCVCI